MLNFKTKNAFRKVSIFLKQSKIKKSFDCPTRYSPANWIVTLSRDQRDMDDDVWWPGVAKINSWSADASAQSRTVN